MQRWQAGLLLVIYSLACETTQLVNGWQLYLLEQSTKCDVSWQSKEGHESKVWLRVPAVTGLS